VNFAPGKIPLGGKSPKDVYSVPDRKGPNTCKVWLTSVERRQCSNEAKMRNPLKFAGMPRTRQPISAVGRPTFTILWGHVEELLFKKFFSDCPYMP